MAFQNILISILTIFIIIVVSSLPLHLSVLTLGGRSSILKSFMVMLGTGVLSIGVNFIFPIWGTIIAWVLLIWIFHEVFRLRWLKAVIAWILWLVFIFIFIFIFTLIGFANIFIFSL